MTAHGSAAANQARGELPTRWVNSRENELPV